MKMKLPAKRHVAIFGVLVTASCLVIANEINERERLQQEVVYRMVEKTKSLTPTVPMRGDLEEKKLKGEDEAIQKAQEDVIRTILFRAMTGETHGIAKGDHGKSQACLKGTITFKKEIPGVLRKGVVIPGAIYQVDARLSNAEVPADHDRTSFSQGVAVKLKNISKNTGDRNRIPDFADSDEQDFLMTSDPVFMVSTIMEYQKGFHLRSHEPGKIEGLMLYLNKNFRPVIKHKKKDVPKMLKGELREKWARNMLIHPYWGKHPYAWGEHGESGTHAVKYSVAPCHNTEVLSKSDESLEYQKKFIEEGFSKNGEICFNLRIQSRPAGSTEEDYPIEDAHKEWLESAAPFVNVATIRFPAERNQDWNSKEAQDACVRTEFSPWNGLLAHQPLGNIARGRRLVYKASALVREEKAALDPRIEKSVKDDAAAEAAAKAAKEAEILEMRRMAPSPKMFK
jgi:hypothetical protein